MFGVENAEYGLLASVTAALISTAGIVAVAMTPKWAKRNGAYLSAFAVGLLSVGVAFHLIPEAIDSSSFALGWVAVGFALMVLIGIFVQTSVSRRPEGVALTFGYASIIALAAHSLLDGVIYAASFPEGPFTGLLATGGLLLHEFPEGVIAYSLLLTAGIGHLRAGLLAFAAASLTTIGGTIGAYFAISFSAEPPLAAMLGCAAGALIYVLIVHLGPHAAAAPNRRGYDLAGLGVIIGTLAIVMQSAGSGH